MPRLTNQPLGSLETAVMTVLWSADRALTVGDVHAVLCQQPPDMAYVTTMTVMNRLVQKGFLTRASKRPGRGSAYNYTPALSRGQVLAAAIEQFCTSLGADRYDRAEALAVILGAPQ